MKEITKDNLVEFINRVKELGYCPHTLLGSEMQKHRMLVQGDRIGGLKTEIDIDFVIDVSDIDVHVFRYGTHARSIGDYHNFKQQNVIITMSFIFELKLLLKVHYYPTIIQQGAFMIVYGGK